MLKTTKVSFGQRLRALRMKRGLAVSEVAARIGVPASTYREWEYGRRIRGEPYCDLARCFGITLSELFLGGNSKRELAEGLEQIEALAQNLRTKL